MYVCVCHSNNHTMRQIAKEKQLVVAHQAEAKEVAALEQIERKTTRVLQSILKVR